MPSSKNVKVPTPHEWAKKTARRLRVSHHSFADQEFEEKREFLEDELDFALGEVGAEKGSHRDRYLEALVDLFPVFGDESGPAVVSEPVGDQESKSPVEAAMEAWNSASEDEKAEIKVKMGIMPLESSPKSESSGVGLPKGLALGDDRISRADLDRTLEQIRNILQLSGDDELSFTRLLKLTGILVDNFEKLHSFVWDFWEFMCPKDLVGLIEPVLPGTLQQGFQDYLSGDSETSSGHIHRELETAKLLVLAICSSISQGGEEFGRSFAGRFSPDEIESSVVIEDTGGDPSRIRDLEKKAWIKYRQLARTLTPEGVDDELRVLLGRVIAAWIKRNRK